MTLPPDPRTTYDATDPVEDAPLAHKHALTRAVKRVIELSAHLDVDAMPDATVEALTAEIDALADRVEERKIFVWGTADCDGVRLAEAAIVFIAPPDGRPRSPSGRPARSARLTAREWGSAAT